MIDDVFGMMEHSKNSRQVYMLVDISNHMHRNRHGAICAGGDDVSINEYALHLSVAGLDKLYQLLQPTKIVAAIDYGSWRKEVFPMYKALRHADRKSDEGFAAFMVMADEFKQLIKEYSSIICLEAKNIEADDWIARWIQTHPDDEHIIVSSDGDFHQLHAPNVRQYNPVAKKWVIVDDPKFAIFVKCIRGETGRTSDNIPSAYPRVRIKELEKAFYGDTFLMETIMQHKVPDIANLDKNEKPIMSTTGDLFNRNNHLMNLTEQPQEIIDIMDDIIKTAQEDVNKFDMFHVLKWLGKNNLIKLGENIDHISKMLKL